MQSLPEPDLPAMPQPSPQLIFFTELETAALGEVMRQPAVVDTLATQEYGVAVATHDWSAERAEVVRMLNARGIAVTAWLLLSEEAGYWFNVENYPQAIAHYHAFRQWARTEGLRFAAVGLDMQPSLPQRAGLRSMNPLAIYSAVANARSNALFPAAYEAYHDLVALIRSDGYAVHTYQYPLVVDDRRAATTLIQRALNVVALPVDLEVLLCYSSLIPRALFGSDLGGALIAEYGVHADSIGIGSTGGGSIIDSSTDAQTERLSWNAFTRDLRLAARYTDTIYIFSLEGCLASGYFEHLAGLDWSVPVTIPARYRFAARLLRLSIAAVLWWSRSGLTVMGWLGWVVAGAMVLRRLARRLRKDVHHGETETRR